MDLHLLHLPLHASLPTKHSKLFHLQARSHSSNTKMAAHDQNLTFRRSASYHPSIWDHQFFESMTSIYSDERYKNSIMELKQKARRLLEAIQEPMARLRLIDSMQRLGLAYHFEKEIKAALGQVYGIVDTVEFKEDLYTTSLCFRLLRQHAYNVSSDMFKKFKVEGGGFNLCMSGDVRALLSLYEASHMEHGEEEILEEAKEFSTRHLKEALKGSSMEARLAEQVKHALEIPLHWRMPRLEAKNYISVYEREDWRSPVLLELAKLDFNMVQSIHQRDLKELSRWWNNLGFSKKLSFSRDRLMENFLWGMGLVCEPQFSNCRKGVTKLVAILTAIDDIYDVYGSLDELELFTHAVERWDISAMDNLPYYMKICYLALFNFTNEVAYDTLRGLEGNIIGILKEEWGRLCKAYLMEARWFNNGYTPTLEEYIGNSWVSVGGPVAMVHAYFLLEQPTTQESIHRLQQGLAFIYWSSKIVRLSDDLGTSTAELERGDVPKSIQCYMQEAAVSEEAAREHIKELINDSWKSLNQEVAITNLPSHFVNIVLNMARTSQCIFEYGDGIGTSHGVTKDRVTSLFIEPAV